MLYLMIGIMHLTKSGVAASLRVEAMKATNVLVVASRLSAFKAARPTITGLWTRGRKIVNRLNDLENRVAELETRLKDQPPDACPFCGKRAMRMYYSSPPLMERNPIARFEDWVCQSCGNQERRARLY